MCSDCSVYNATCNLIEVLSSVGMLLVVQKSLEVGEVLSVDVSSIIALSGTVNVQVKYNGPMRRVVFGVIFSRILLTIVIIYFYLSCISTQKLI